MTSIVLASGSIDPLWWCELLHGVTAACVFLSLSIFRLHGYRLWKTPLRARGPAMALVESA
jgi:hypothetical protein